jgi:cellulose synthase/poly-beta-1,6-N-acetylglucosamine synthase-like glycosyltransferase
MPERLGKTSAVKLALETLDQQSFTGLVLMTDADALISKGTIKRLHGWFSDPTIGAVGSRANRQTNLHGEKDYRSLYEMLRIAESKRDSTPFLEGSCMMWRHGSFRPDDLLIESNADDAQIASLIRFGGLRSIFDEDASFIDFAPTTVEGQSRQKVRRAQGLQNILDKFPKQHKLPDEGHFSTIFRTQMYFHSVVPVMLFQIAIVATIRWIYVSATSMPVGYEAVLHAILSFTELLMLVSWLTFRNGIKLPLLATIGTLLTSFEYLLIARYRNSSGKLSHKWDQHRDVRQLMDKF